MQIFNKLGTKRFGEFGSVLIRFSSSQLISNILVLVSGFLVVRLVDPKTYGLFSGYQIYLGYILLMHGGILNGLNRELPFLLGKGNNKYGEELASSANLLTLVIGLISFSAFSVFSLIQLFNKQYLLSIILISYSIVAFFHTYNRLFLPFLYRTNKDFNSLARQRIKNGIANLLTVVVVWLFGIYGLCLRVVSLAAYLFFLLYKNKPYKLKLSFNIRNYKHLIKIGFPIFLVGRTNPLWKTIINNYIFAVGGPQYYGYFVLSVIIENSVNIIPQSFGQIIYPRMNIMFGRGESIKYILKSNVKPLIFQFFFLSIVSAIGWFILPFLVRLLLPKYSPGIGAAQWAFLIPVSLSIGALNNIYNVIGKQQYLLISLIGGALIGTVYMFFVIRVYGFYLETFVQGMVIGNFTQQIFGLLFLLKIRNLKINSKND